MWIHAIHVHSIKYSHISHQNIYIYFFLIEKITPIMGFEPELLSTKRWVLYSLKKYTTNSIKINKKNVLQMIIKLEIIKYLLKKKEIKSIWEDFLARNYFWERKFIHFFSYDDKLLSHHHFSRTSEKNRKKKSIIYIDFIKYQIKILSKTKYFNVYKTYIKNEM